MMKNPKIVFLVLGIIVGGIIGFMTRPESMEIRIGGLNIQVTGKGIAGPNDTITSDQAKHIALLTSIGAIIGLGFGFAVESGKIKF